MPLENDNQAVLGEHIRSEVLPRGISVKAAAESLGGALERSIELAETLLADHARS